MYNQNIGIMEVNRICIYPKDIQFITGKSERYGRKLLKKVKDNFAKEAHQFVTIDEFCLFTGLNIEHVNSFLKGR
jgi:hypothetical protein